MNPLDRIVSFFSPKAGLERARARYAMRIYDGATRGRRGSAWRATHASANSEIGPSMRELRNRARDLVRNTPYATRALDIIVGNAIGTGIRPVSRTTDDKLDKRVSAYWDEWQSQADIEDDSSFNAMQILGLRSMVESGEIVYRFLNLRPSESKSKIPLKLQLLEADLIDHEREGFYGGNEVPAKTETQRSRLGVGLGAFDRRTGLWLHPYHPGEMISYSMKPTLSRFHPQDEILHVFKKQRPGQVRGVSWFANVLMTARELADFLDSVQVKARAEACFTAFVTNSAEAEEPIFDAAPEYGAQRDGSIISMLEPGVIKELKQGQDIKFAAPTGTSQIEPVLLNCLMAWAAGVGVTYDQLTGDLRQANYSSLRAGKLEFRRQVEQLQNELLIPRICQPVWDRFISRAILVGALKEREGGYPCAWVTPAWEAINPKFDLESEEKSVRAGRMPPQDFMASWGYEWRETIDKWAEFNAYAKAKGVTFDIMVDEVTRTGQFQADPTAQGGGFPKAAANDRSVRRKNGAAEETVLDANGNPVIDGDSRSAIPFEGRTLN